MSVKKEQLSITFTDGTEGTITTETTKGRVDVKAEYEGVRIYYYTEKVDNSWLVKKCNEGRCYDTVIIADRATRKEAIAEIILDVRKNQVRTAYTYILETSSGRMFEVVATSESLAKKCVRFECAISEDKLHTKEIKKADEAKQHKAKIGDFADFINETLPAHSDVEPVKDDDTVENEESNSQTYKGYTITGNVNSGFVALASYGYYTGKVYETEEEAISDIDKDIADSVPIEETDSFEESVEVLDKAHEILSNPLTELDVRVSAVKSVFNRYYGKQVIDAEMNIIKTELTGFHVTGIITETGTMMLSCDIYAQDLDIRESYLAYNVGSGYALYDEISLTRVGLYPHAEGVRQFFAIRVNALETETLKRLY